MNIAFIIYNGMTTLDFIGGYDPLTRLKTMNFMPEVQWDICAYTNEVQDNAGLRIVPTQIRPSLANYGLLYVPGGFSTRELVHDDEFVAWLKTAATCKLKVSVCTGALLLGVAGFLKGKRATTHPLAFEDLKPYCATVLDERVVDAGEVITARGVTSALDLGLYVCEKLAGHQVKERIRKQMDYMQ